MHYAYAHKSEHERKAQVELILSVGEHVAPRGQQQVSRSPAEVVIGSPSHESWKARDKSHSTRLRF